MSKSLTRLSKALIAAGIDSPPMDLPADARTAEQAAQALGCALDQIVKSILFQGESGRLFLFLTAGGQQVAVPRAEILAGEALSRADATLIRAVTGFAIGGVAPLGHLTASPTWMDQRLMAFDTVWAAAGTPRHLFRTAPAKLLQATKATLSDFTT